MDPSATNDESAPREETPPAGAPDLPAQIVEEELARLRRALQEKTREAETAQDRYLRALAELDNSRKRAQREREDYIRFANESLIRELLAALDNFDRALQAARSSGESPAFVGGMELIHRELLRVLEKFGVTTFTSVGQPFNPEFHEAVARVAATEQAAMTVVEETRRGYLLNGRVLRPAMVTVAVPPEEPAPPDA
jgi:molecular chaperone GrpE